MTQIKKYNYNEKEISCIVSNDTSRNYLWIGFKQDASGVCKLKKVSANNPLQIYYDIDVNINEIIKGVISGSYLYLAFDDSSLIGKKYLLSNPLTSTTDFNIPSGISEPPVDILADTYINFLIPGNNSGTNAKIVRMTTSGSFYETIDLPTVINAISFVKVGNEFWVATDTTPGSYVRVYDSGGWTYTKNY